MSGAAKASASVKAPGALAVARNMDERERAILRLAGQRAGEIRDAEGVEPVAQRRKRQRAALGELGDGAFEISHDKRSIRALAPEKGIHAARPKMASCPDRIQSGVEGDDPAKQQRIISLRRWRLARRPGENVAVDRLQQGLEIVELALAQVCDLRIGETAEEQIGFQHAAMPGAEFDRRRRMSSVACGRADMEGLRIG